MVKFEPSNDMVSRGVFEQVMWERDVAIEQLKELGYELGQKVEPCDDAVSRQAAIDALYHVDEYNGRSIEAIRDLPPVTPQPKTGHWIPVSERLPEEMGEYLITIKARPYLEISWFYPSNKEWSYRNADIIAWMPLPKPYEPQESNDKCKNCEYYRNPDYTRCHECKAESEE